MRIGVVSEELAPAGSVRAYRPFAAVRGDSGAVRDARSGAASRQIKYLAVETSETHPERAAIAPARPYRAENPWERKQVHVAAKDINFAFDNSLSLTTHLSRFSLIIAHTPSHRQRADLYNNYID